MAAKVVKFVGLALKCFVNYGKIPNLILQLCDDRFPGANREKMLVDW